MSKWYYAVDDRQFGPVEETELRTLITHGDVRPNDLVWTKGFTEWRELGEVPEFQTSTVSPEPIQGVFLECDNGENFPIREGQTTVGRGEENDLVIPSRYVSTLHAIFENQNGRVWLTDLGSRNGTYRNDVRLFAEERVALAPGDEIRITGKGRLMRIRGNQLDQPRPFESEPVSLNDLEKAAAGQASEPLTNPDPDPAAMPNPERKKENAFGFTEESVQFRNLGVGDEAAATLAKRFKPISVLNQGGMGKVILAQDLLAGRFVAVKIMLERIVGSEPHVHQFIREAVITARLQHPHIIPVYDLGFFTDNQLFYTMRYVEGKDFGRLRDDMDLLERVRILRCAAQAVDHAHSLGLWHRDLKPANILVGPLGDTYVIDWGLVSVQPGKGYKLEIPRVVVDQQAIVVPDKLIEQTEQALTAASVAQNKIIGTPAYMAPEQAFADHDRMGIVSDVWTFGIMLYEAIAEEHPFEKVLRQTPARVLEAVMEAKIPPLPEDSPPVLAQLCQQMLKRDADSRMPHLEDFIRETGRFLRRNSKYF